MDLGYVYRQGGVVSASAKDTPGSEVSTYSEVFGAGARLPDRELADGSRLHQKLNYRAFTLFLARGASPDDVDTFGVAVDSVEVDGNDLDGHSWVFVRPDGHVLAVG